MTGESKAKKPAAVVLGVLGAIIGAFFGKQLTSKLFDRQPDVRSQEFLSKVASEINKGVPTMVDKDTELINAVGLPSTIGYNYRLVNYSASELDPKVLVSNLKPLVTNGVCTTPETRDKFLKQGITMRYSYADKDRVHVATFDVKPSDCGF